MRRPASAKGAVNRAARNGGAVIPAPTGGWDQKNPLANMPADSAVILDNWIPRAGYVEMRRGFTQQVTGTPAAVETILVWTGSTTPNSDKLFACAGNSIYDVSVQGNALGAAVVAGLANARWQSTNFANSGSAWLIAVNGADAPHSYDGAAWAALAITGSSGPIVLDPTTLVHVMMHKSRLMFVEKGTLRIWFLDVNAIQGSAQLLDLGPVFNKGGTLQCCASWTLDGGQGADDFAVFITDKGQVAVYQGTDPSDATNWSRVGTYDLGPPMGRRATLKYGADVMVQTTEGVLPLSQALRFDRSQDEDVAITSKIQNAFFKATSAYGANFGWEAVPYPAGSIVIFNVPVFELQSSVQYVQNTQTGAWCSFSNINAFCWAVANGKPYFGATDGVYQWDVGANDNGLPVTADVLPAFSNFQLPGRQKQFSMVRPILRAPSVVAPALEMMTDYAQRTPTAVPTVVIQPQATWDQAMWDESSWADPNTIRYDWTSVGGGGFTGSPRRGVAVQSNQTTRLAIGDGFDLITGDGFNVLTQSNSSYDIPVQLIGFDVQFEVGGAL